MSANCGVREFSRVPCSHLPGVRSPAATGKGYQAQGGAMTMSSVTRVRAFLLGLAITACLGAVGASGASATSATFCGGGFTPAHGWCYHGVNAAWKYVEADYSGSGSF